MTPEKKVIRAARNVLKAVDENHRKQPGALKWICPWGELVKLMKALESYDAK